MDVRSLFGLMMAYIPNRYMQSFVIVFVGVFLSILFRLVFVGYMKRIADKTKTNIDDYIVQYITKPVFYTIMLVAIRFAIANLSATNFLIQIVDTLLIITITYIIVGIIDVFIDAWGEAFAKRTASKTDDQLIPLFHKAIKAFLIILAMILILGDWGVEIGPFIASLGIAGIALGFALQDSLGNIFGGVSLIIDKSYQIGDIIQLEGGDMGEVIDVGLRSTKIKTFDNEVLTVPNGKLSNAMIRNRVQPDIKLRIAVPFGVEYGTDVDKVKRVVLKTLDGLDYVITDDPEPSVRFLEMADFSLNFTLFFYINDYKERITAIDEVNTRIYNALNKAKIGIPFPTQTIHVIK